MKMSSSLLSVLMLNLLYCMVTSYATPLLNTKNYRDVSTPVTKCSPDEQCWKWLSALETRDDTVFVTDQQDDDTSKLQFRRQIKSPSSTLKSWQDGITATTERVIRPPVPINKQIPVRTTKKDAFGSRSWGAGGMPFSVLYMNPHHSRSNVVTMKSTTQRPESTATTKSSNSLPFERPNYQRKRQPTMQPRRQFLPIPQLFISYGWDAYGK